MLVVFTLIRVGHNYLFCIFIHLAFISATISRPGEGNRLLPLKREGRRGAYADRDDDVSVGFLSLFYFRFKNLHDTLTY